MLSAKVLQRLKEILAPKQVLTDPDAIAPYGFDKGRHHGTPDAVVFAETHNDVVAIVKFCYAENIPLTARGLGSGMPGGCIPTQGGIVISLEKMTQIIKIDSANRVMIVEPGITNLAVQQAAAQYGFFWAPDPGSASYCTVGGNLAHNAAGPHAIKYGTPRENTLGLHAVIGTGETIKTGVYTTKGVVGYDLTRLLIGSEGTLGIITQATLKLLPLPEVRRTVRLLYKDLQSAMDAVVNIMAQPHTPAALEYMDHHAIRMIKEFYKKEKMAISPFNQLPDAAQAVLLIEVDGSKTNINEIINAIKNAGTNAGFLDFIAANNDAESQLIWEARRHLSPALKCVAPTKINEDIVVPVANLPRLIENLNQLAAKYGVTIVNFGHAGNGNLHVNIMFDGNDPFQKKNADVCLNEVFALALKLNGSLSGEHGVGIDKRFAVPNEIDPVSLDLMRKIKQQFDPKGILNPGKIF